MKLRISKCAKAHTIDEEVLLSSAKNIVGEPLTKQQDMIPLSNDSSLLRMKNMVSYVTENMIAKDKKIFFCHTT